MKRCKYLTFLLSPVELYRSARKLWNGHLLTPALSMWGRMLASSFKFSLEMRNYSCSFEDSSTIWIHFYYTQFIFIRITNSSSEHLWVVTVMWKKRYLAIFKANYQSTAPSNFCSVAPVKEDLNTCIKLYTKWVIYYLQTYTHKCLTYQKQKWTILGD